MPRHISKVKREAMDACANGVECRGAGAVTCNNMLTVAALVDSVGTLPFQTVNQTNLFLTSAKKNLCIRQNQLLPVSEWNNIISEHADHFRNQLFNIHSYFY